MRSGVLLLLLVALGCNPPAFAQKASQTAGDALRQAQAAAQRAEEAARIAVAARAEAEKRAGETLKKLDAASTEIMGRANFLQTTSTVITGFVAFAFAVFGILGGVVAVVGGHRMSDSLKKIKQGEEAASASVAKIAVMEEGIEKHKLFVNNLELQVAAALAEIRAKMDAALTPGTALIGVGLAAAAPQRSYDDDALIALSDRLRITGDDLPPAQLAAFLVTVANYWRRWKEYDRAIERARRALELDASSPSTHKTLGRAIWNRVAEDLTAGSGVATSHGALLADAEAELKTAQSLLAKGNAHDEEIPYDLAAICRFRGNISGAVIQYQRGGELSKALALNEGREPDWDFEFGLACLYAHSGQYQNALDQMKGVVGKTKSWSQERRRVEDRDYRDWMRSDPDFAAMRADATWAPQLTAL